VRPEYEIAATNLGRALTRRNIALVYGGARVGLMRAVADAVLETGGKVVGVIPELLVSRELPMPA
jgi:predicted Rossmann-fold nucleotide-binding protein